MLMNPRAVGGPVHDSSIISVIDELLNCSAVSISSRQLATWEEDIRSGDRQAYADALQKMQHDRPSLSLTVKI
ncbi:hypothetical protein EVAR_17546_1 [Eumeta japonica]|uniref:Uncharacterized protein n=1 Tax=Eumeta variegata TaxID=151549 RepID=A0A4C1WRJ4_EUMVA|nr:hypothetical protein EVAR_17546_1 [Eumeta japonica]